MKDSSGSRDVPEGMVYNNPVTQPLKPDGAYIDSTDPKDAASIGVQSEAGRAYLMRQALEYVKDATPFTNMASVTHMPKNSGKYLEVFEEFPLIDDRNKNSQGLDAKGAFYDNGNFYGNSDDIGTINSKMPTLNEVGGRVNRVGFSRAKRMGTFSRYGFFFEYTQSALDYDTDPQLYAKMYRKALEGAAKLYEDKLQIDLLNNAGTIMFAGTSFSLKDNTLNNLGVPASTGQPTKLATTMKAMGEHNMLTYKDLTRLQAALDKLDVPSTTTIISGSAKIDTLTLSTKRVAYCGPEVIDHLDTLLDNHGRPAFIPIEKYAGAIKPLPNEVGSIAGFRVIKIQKFKVWRGAGADASGPTLADTYYTSADASDSNKQHFDVFPFLVIGDQAFTTIGFKSSGMNNKFQVLVQKPGQDAVTRQNPFGDVGLVSIKWNYGFMLLRPERLAIIRTVVKR